MSEGKFGSHVDCSSLVTVITRLFGKQQALRNFRSWRITDSTTSK